MVNHGSVDSLGEQEGVVKFEYDHDKNTLRQVFIPNPEIGMILRKNTYSDIYLIPF